MVFLSAFVFRKIDMHFRLGFNSFEWTKMVVLKPSLFHWVLRFTCGKKVFEVPHRSLAASWPLGRAFLESILQHDPKTVQMGLVMRPTWAQNGFKNRHCAGAEHVLQKNDGYMNPTWLQHGPSKAEVHIKRARRHLVGAKTLETWNSQATGERSKTGKSSTINSDIRLAGRWGELF